MISKRKGLRSDAHDERHIEESPKTKKPRISGKKSCVPQDGVVEDNTVFGKLLKTAGIILMAGERQNEIAVDGAIFQKKLQQALRKHPSYPQITEEFINGLESHIENRDQFRNCLLPCVPAQSQETSSAIHSYCESLIKLLLGIEILQPPVIRLLFEKLPEFFHESVGSDGLNLPRLIINQLKWLDRIVDSQDLVSTIMQMICVSPSPIQHDIITSLPEILEDAQHSEMARELSSLLKEKTELTVPILDALSSLNLDLGLLSEVRQSVMVTVAAVKMEDLPVVVKFVLRSIKATDAVEVLSDLRTKVDLDSCVSFPRMQASQNKLRSQLPASLSASQVSLNQDCVKLLFEVIKSAVKFEKTVLEGWVKAIEDVSSASDHKVLDLIVLLIIYATNGKSKKQIERVLRNKIRLGCVREQLLRNAFRSHSLVMRDLFPAVLSLAENFVHSADPCVVSFGSCLYKQAFTAFDSYCQQEIVGALVTHACGGNSIEVDISLDVLTDLVALHTSSIAPYAVFLKSILDYMENLSPQQIRKLFHILSVLAFSQGHKSSHIQDDMHMVIRKQLSSTIPKYKRIGIIGAVTMVGSMATKRSKENGQILERAQLSKDQCRQITSLLELVCSCCGQVPEALALYYDELANLIQRGSLDLQILEWMGNIVVKDFEGDFVTDLVATDDSAFLFPVKALYSLEEEESEATIAINLLPLLSQNYLFKNADEEMAAKSKDKRLVSPLCLSPFFRLLRLCVSELNNGNLEDIDALLVCPLYLTSLEVGGKLDSLSKHERDFLCSLLFYALNWFREVVNAFCQQKDPEIKGRVLARLQNITELQSLLEKHLTANPGYIPPPANFDSETLEGLPVANTTGASKKKGKGQKHAKSDTSKSRSEDSSQLEENTEANQPESESSQLDKDSPDKGQGTPLVQLQSYSPYFRELDLEVFTILHSGLLTKSVLDTEMHTKTCEVVQIGPAELLFLLEDLCRKMEHALMPAPAKRAPFLKGKGNRNVGFSHLCQLTSQAVVEHAVDLLKPLCNHVENMHNYFQATTAENHGVVDGPKVNVQEYQLMSSCYQRLLQVFYLLFAWSGFSQPENHGLLKLGLHVFADRLKPGERERPLEELLSQGFQYLVNLKSSVPSIYCALSLTRLLLVIAEKSVARLKKNEIASVTKCFLCQSWVQPNGARQKGTQFNDALHTLFCIYMEHTDNILKVIEDISSIGIPELMQSKDGYSSTYPTLTRQTFPIFFRVMIAQLENSVRSIPAGTPSDSNEAQQEKLLQWNMAVRDFHILVNLVKVFDSRPVLSVCLKYGRLFVETFLKYGMPLLDCSFKKHRADVQSLLKTLQLSTRQLHHMCGHSKIHQDTGLTSHVPLLKKSLELFVYRVKAMLALNHCQEAFWVGVLKNRDLQGEEILSQASQTSEMEEEEEVSMIASEDPVEEQRQEEDTETEDGIDLKNSDDDSSD